MTRLVDHEHRSPLKIDAEDLDERKGDVAICRCGLAESYPFCDGSHRATLDEEDGALYHYEEHDHDADETEIDGDAGTDEDDGRPRRAVERIVYAEE